MKQTMNIIVKLVLFLGIGLNRNIKLVVNTKSLILRNRPDVHIENKISTNHIYSIYS
jgi:hypothetical protein